MLITSSHTCVVSLTRVAFISLQPSAGSNNFSKAFTYIKSLMELQYKVEEAIHKDSNNSDNLYSINIQYPKIL